MNVLPSVGRTEPIHHRNPRLQDGEVLRGKVIQLLGAEEAVVEINGRMIKAAVEVPVKPGSGYLFQFFREPEGFRLKIIKELGQENQGRKETAEALVRYFGLPSDARSTALVRLFYLYNVPMNRTVLKQALKWLGETDSDSGFQALKVILAKKWPLSESLFKALSASAAQAPAGSMKALLQVLKQYDARHPSQKAILDFLENWPGTNIAVRIDELLEHIRAMGRDETQMATLRDWFVARYPEYKEQILSHWPEAKTFLPKMKTEQDLRTLTLLLGLSIREDEWLPMFINDFFPYRKPFSGEWLKHLLFRMGYFYEAELLKSVKNENLNALQWQNSLKGLLLSLTQKNDGHDLIGQLLSQITGEQLQSVQVDRSFVQLWLAFPLYFGSDLRDVHLFWEARRNPDGSVEPDYCRIALKLELSQLGETVVSILVQKRRVSVTVYNEQSMVEALIEQKVSPMKTRLKELGYELVSVKHVTSGLSEAKAIFTPHAGNMDVRI